MPSKPLIRSQTLPYHVYARANNREWFHAPLEQVWNVFLEEAYFVGILFGARLHSLVLMANHFHMVLSTPEKDLGEIMEYFQSNVTRRINLISGREGHVFGGRYKYSLIGSELHYAIVQKYVYRNPVKAGVCRRVEDYPFSTIRGLLGLDLLDVPIHHPFDSVFSISGSEEPFDQLEWLNQPFRKEQEEKVGTALRRKQFEFPGSCRKKLLKDLGVETKIAQSAELRYEKSPRVF